MLRHVVAAVMAAGLSVLLPAAARAAFADARSTALARASRPAVVAASSLSGDRADPALDLPVATVMTREVVSCRPGDTVADIMEAMTRGKFRHLPVQEGGRLIGLISIGDVVKSRLTEYESEQRALHDYIKSA